MRVSDYTALPVGLVMDDGVTEICPHCSKVGLLNEHCGAKFYTHLQRVGFEADGTPLMEWKYCPSPAQDMPA